MDTNTLSELVSALHESGVGSINIIVLETEDKEEEKKEDNKKRKEDKNWWDNSDIEGIIGGMGGGGQSLNGILQGVNTP